MLTRKLNDVSLSGIIANNAVFLSPNDGKSNSSVCVNCAILSKLNFSNLEANVTCMDFNVFADPLW